MQTKTCTKCGQTKPVDQFPVGDKGRPKAACKACRDDYYRAYRTNREGLIKRSYRKEPLGPKQAARRQTPMITLSEAARIFREITGKPISPGFIRTQAYNFPQFAAWSVNGTGEERFDGILPARFRQFVKDRLLMRGSRVKDIFRVSEV